MNPTTYIHVAVEIDARPAFLPSSYAKKHLLRRCKLRCRELREGVEGITGTAVFDAMFVAPARSAFLADSEGCVRVARYDAAILIECRDEAAARAVRRHPAFAHLLHMLDAGARFTHVVTATQARIVAPVDHARGGVFLFNYIFADALENGLDAWGTAAASVAPANAVVLQPSTRSQYTLISHSRWDKAADVLRWLLFRPALRSRLLEAFAKRRAAAMPILYRLA